MCSCELKGDIAMNYIAPSRPSNVPTCTHLFPTRTPASKRPTLTNTPKNNIYMPRYTREYTYTVYINTGLLRSWLYCQIDNKFTVFARPGFPWPSRIASNKNLGFDSNDNMTFFSLRNISYIFYCSIKTLLSSSAFVFLCAAHELKT